MSPICLVAIQVASWTAGRGAPLVRPSATTCDHGVRTARAITMCDEEAADLNFLQTALNAAVEREDYEEAAALGTMAGANAVLAALGGPLVVLRRDEAYIGVLVDDLVRRRWEEGSCGVFLAHIRFYLNVRKKKQFGGEFLDIARPADPNTVGVYHLLTRALLPVILRKQK